jgi:ABC-2 type transport system ATP-binding protein
VSTDTTPAVELAGVTRTFGELTAVAAMSWSLPRGQVLGLLGHNGAGKSTTLRLINGVLTATSGAVRVFGLDPVTHGPQVRRHTGVLHSDPAVDRRLTGRENLRFTGRLYGLEVEEAAERVDELAISFHLDDRLDEAVERYSNGMRQRLALARVLLPNPSLLLLDEPTASLDPMAAHGVRQLVRDIADSRQRTVVIATRNLIEATGLCDQVAVLQRGRVVAFGTPSALASRVRARALHLRISDTDRSNVSDVAVRSGYTIEPLDAGQVAVHGVAYDDVPALVRALVHSDVSVYGINIDLPTLTDFYLALHRENPETSDVVAP